MRAYAEGTSVSVEKTRAEIDTALTRAGASSVGIATDSEKNRAIVAFGLRGARFRIELPIPTIEDVPRHKRRPGAVEQLTRERWRQLLLMLKSKLEIVRIGFRSVEQEFLADMVLPGGATALTVIGEALRRGLAPGELSTRLLGPGEGEEGR